eukprot:6463096-Amphidinium_carterae.1
MRGEPSEHEQPELKLGLRMQLQHTNPACLARVQRVVLVDAREDLIDVAKRQCLRFASGSVVWHCGLVIYKSCTHTRAHTLSLHQIPHALPVRNR